MTEVQLCNSMTLFGQPTPFHGHFFQLATSLVVEKEIDQLYFLLFLAYHKTAHELLMRNVVGICSWQLLCFISLVILLCYIVVYM